MIVPGCEFNSVVPQEKRQIVSHLLGGLLVRYHHHDIVRKLVIYIDVKRENMM